MATEWKCMSKINSKDTSCFLFNFSESIPLPANIYLFKVTIEILKKGEKHVQINKKDTNERRQWRCSRVFIVISNLSHTFLVFLLFILINKLLFAVFPCIVKILFT